MRLKTKKQSKTDIQIKQINVSLLKNNETNNHIWRKARVITQLIIIGMKQHAELLSNVFGPYNSLANPHHTHVKEQRLILNDKDIKLGISLVLSLQCQLQDAVLWKKDVNVFQGVFEAHSTWNLIRVHKVVQSWSRIIWFP